MNKAFTLFTFFSLLALSTLNSQTLFKDILPGSSTSAVDHFTVLNNSDTMVFIARQSTAQGVELFISDGTAGGTTQVKDIYPGSNPSYPLIYHEYNGELFFRASNGINGYELWKSDLTSAGTQLVKDVWVGSSNAVPLTTYGFVIADAGGLMVMPLSDGTTNHGTELWVSDGTSIGTNMLVDIYIGTGSSGPKDFIEVNNFVYFTAYEYDLGAGTGAARELWRTNGTAAGTGQIKDINPGMGSSTPEFLTKVGQNIIFSADDGTNGREVWVSDGTTAGTIMLKDINLSGSSDPEGFTIAGGEIFFFADDGVNGTELWKTDLTTAGTVMVEDINPGPDGSAYIIPYFAEMNGKFYFNATDGVHGNEPWESDGTAAGTRMLLDIRNGQYGSNPSGFFGYNNVVYMSAYTPADGFELWASDGSTTSLIYSFRPGASCGCPADFTFFNSKIFFTADNGTTGREMWSMDPLVEVLPVEFGFFEANPLADGTVKLDWSTEVELNNDYFELERSADGRVFVPFLQVDGKGTTQERSLYTGKDDSPFQGRNYYRIKQVDLNGAVDYSHIAIVNIDAKGTFAIVPNPVTDIATVSIPRFEGQTDIRILDIQGKEVYRALLPSGITHWELQSEGYTAGVYFIEIKQYDTMKRIKFMK